MQSIVKVILQDASNVCWMYVSNVRHLCISFARTKIPISARDFVPTTAMGISAMWILASVSVTNILEVKPAQ